VNKDEALLLAQEIIKDIEKDNIPAENACLKAARLARLLEDNEKINTFTDWSSKITEYRNGLNTLNRVIINPFIPFNKRMDAENQIRNLNVTIQKIRTTLHTYVSDIYYRLKFGAVPQNIFEKTRVRVDKILSERIPDAIKKFVSIYDNLKSNNAEDWANAVHSCRRILKALADKLYPPKNGVPEIDRGGKKIQIGPDNYINRLKIYVEERSRSEKFRKIVGSHLEYLEYLGKRLDAIYEASCKGSHDEINSIEEAERYIIYTYMLIGDILTLTEE